ncbi:MAG: nucleoside monophosphate kinase [bacterium]
MIENKKTIFTMMGLPASGKGTQATMLSEKFGLSIVGVGNLVREEMKKNSDDPFVADIKKRYDAGIPQPDEVAIDLVKNYLEEHQEGVIFDNFPFREGQAKFIDQYIDEHPKFEGPVVIYIKIAPETAVKRVTSRRVCSECGAIYAASDEMICDKCGGSLIVRADDNEETMRKRIDFYLPRIKEMVEYYSKKNKVIIIDGEKSVSEVSKSILEQI